MYRRNTNPVTLITRNTSEKGESIEEKIRRILKNNEPIKDIAPAIFSERKDGVLPQYDIRTDRFEYALDAMDKASAARIAQRENRLAEEAKKNMEKEKKSETDKLSDGTESTGGSDGK